MQIQSIMTPLNRFLQPTDELDEAEHMFDEESLDLLPVCDEEGTLMGTIETNDVDEAVNSAESSEEALVGTVMSKELLSCSEGDDVMNLALKAKHQGLTHAIVLNEQGGLVGVANLTPYQRQREPNAGRQENTLDNALDGTFPASDPVPPP